MGVHQSQEFILGSVAKIEDSIVQVYALDLICSFENPYASGHGVDQSLDYHGILHVLIDIHNDADSTQTLAVPVRGNNAEHSTPSVTAIFHFKTKHAVGFFIRVQIGLEEGLERMNVIRMNSI